MRRSIRNLLILSLVVLLTGLSNAALAIVSDVPLDQLQPDRTHRQTALIVTKVVEKYHYRSVVLDDEMADKILDRYIESLDPNKSFFTQHDMDDFSVYRKQLDDDIVNGRLEPAYTIFKRFRNKLDSRVALALRLLEENKFDFSRSEQYQFDRADAQWVADEAAMEDLWRRRVKNDILGLRLSGKAEDEITETLRKRYESLRRRTHQFDADDVFQVFINAYTLTVEPHTSYMSPSRSENFDISMRLSLQGIGAVLRSKNEYTMVQSTVPGGPADKTGALHAGDKIIGVAQGAEGEMEDVLGWRLQDVVEKIRGKKGTTVRLEVLPKASGSNGQSREVVILRDEIKLEDQAAKSSIIENIEGLNGMRFGVIDLPAFYRDFKGQVAGKENFRSTTRDVRQLLKELEQAKVDGVIIDLRQNGGGSLTEATELTGLFIKQGPVVQVKDSRGKVEIERDQDPEQVYEGPLVVLVDRNSASASEIFAGAIQDYERGLVIGEPTFGKGTVQTLVDLGQFSRGDDDLGRLRLTIAQFFRVQGGSTQHRGVMPDLVFPTAKGAAEHGERSFDNSLPWASIKPVEHQVLGVPSLARLREKHADRVTRDPGFIYLVDQEDEILEVQEEETVSLIEVERKREWSERETRHLDRRNRLRVYRGLDPLATLDDEDEDEADIVVDKEDDPEGVNRIMQEEAARILADAILQHRPITAQIN